MATYVKQEGGAGAQRHAPFGLLKELERPGDVVRDLGPNWFASVMGTGIVATAGADLPVYVPGLRVFATVVWALAAAALIALTAAWAVPWIRYPDLGRAHTADPVMAQFWGAPAMALMTVGTGTLVLGHFALLYGVPTWGFAMMWLALAAAITARTARQHLPFALTWWSFTFPVGTCVTGTIALAARSHAEALRGATVLLYGFLVAVWLVVAVRSAYGSATGRLFRPTAPAVARP